MNWVHDIIIFALCASCASRKYSESANPHLIGGSKIIESEFPAVSAWRDEQGAEKCTVTLIRSNVILTASHCLPFSPFSDRPGLNQKDSISFAGEKYHPIKGVFPPLEDNFRWCFDHHFLNAQYCLNKQHAYIHDFAVIQLDRNVAGVEPAKVAWKGLVDADVATYVGYGCQDPHNQNHSSRGDKQIFETIWGQRGKNICTGDSGAAIFNKASGEIAYIASMGAEVDNQPSDEFAKVGDSHDMIDKLILRLFEP